SPWLAPAPLKHENRPANRHCIPVSEPGSTHPVVVKQHRVRRLTRLDLTLVANVTKHRMVSGHLWIVEQIDVRARRRPNVHYILEKYEFLAGERSLRHAQPGVPRQQFHNADHRPDSRSNHGYPYHAAPVSTWLISSQQDLVNRVEQHTPKQTA